MDCIDLNTVAYLENLLWRSSEKKTLFLKQIQKEEAVRVSKLN